jgi:hypothetical protein
MNTVNDTNLVGKTVVLPIAGGQFEIVTIRTVDHIATVTSREDADRLVKIVSAEPPAKAVAPAPKAAMKPVNGRRKKVVAGARIGIHKKGAPGRKKAAGRKKAVRARSAGTPNKEVVDVGKLADIVSEATK